MSSIQDSRAFEIAMLTLASISFASVYINLIIFVRFYSEMLRRSINRLLFGATLSELCRFVVEVILWSLLLCDRELRESTCKLALSIAVTTTTWTAGFIGFYYIQILAVVMKNESVAAKLVKYFTAIIVVVGLATGITVYVTMGDLPDRTTDTAGVIQCHNIMAASEAVWIVPSTAQAIAVLSSLIVVIKVVRTKSNHLSRYYWPFLSIRAGYVFLFSIAIVGLGLARFVKGAAGETLEIVGFSFIYVNGFLLLLMFCVTEGPFLMLSRRCSRGKPRETGSTETSSLVRSGSANRLEETALSTVRFENQSSLGTTLSSAERRSGLSDSLAGKSKIIDFASETLAGIICEVVVEAPPKPSKIKATAYTTTFRLIDAPGEDSPSRIKSQPSHQSHTASSAASLESRSGSHHSAGNVDG